MQRVGPDVTMGMTVIPVVPGCAVIVVKIWIRQAKTARVSGLMTWVTTGVKIEGIGPLVPVVGRREIVNKPA